VRFDIDYSTEAERDIEWFDRGAQVLIREAVERQLRFEPTQANRNRKPHRRTRAIPADWELRVGPFRIFYDVDTTDATVGIVDIGYKPRETLYVAGKPVVDADIGPGGE